MSHSPPSRPRPIVAFLQAGASEHIEFQHAAAENTGRESGSADLVSACLVLHEVPQHGTRAILTEAFRLLQPGGTLAIMVLPTPHPFTSCLIFCNEDVQLTHGEEMTLEEHYYQFLHGQFISVPEWSWHAYVVSTPCWSQPESPAGDEPYQRQIQTHVQQPLCIRAFQGHGALAGGIHHHGPIREPLRDRISEYPAGTLHSGALQPGGTQT